MQCTLCSVYCPFDSKLAYVYNSIVRQKLSLLFGLCSDDPSLIELPGPKRSLMKKLFVDQTFRLYKSNTSLPELSQEEISYLKTLVGKYLFHSVSNDIINSYSTYKDYVPGIKVAYNKGELKDVRFTSVTASYPSLLPKQTLIFVSDYDGFNYSIDMQYRILVLVRFTNTSLAEIIMQGIQNLNFETPMVLRPLNLPSNCVPRVIDRLSMELLNFDLCSEAIGDLELTYQLTGLVTSNTLKDIIINVSRSELNALDKSRGVIEGISAFLKKNTLMEFRNIPLVRFVSSLFSFSQDGKVKISNISIHLINSILESTNHHSLLSDQNDANPGLDLISSVVKAILDESFSA